MATHVFCPFFLRLRNGVKFCKMQSLPEVYRNSNTSNHKKTENSPVLHTGSLKSITLLVFLDPVCPLETLQTWTDVLHQDKHPCLVPARGLGPAAFSGQRQPRPDHQLWPAVSHLSPRHCQQWVGAVPPLTCSCHPLAQSVLDYRVGKFHMYLLYECCSNTFSRLIPGGHYIAYCRNDVNNLWYEFDDQSVTEVSESCVQNAEAYVLFYK